MLALMHVSYLTVISIDGKMTRGDEPPARWASAEDQTFFFDHIAQANLIVMGRETYTASRSVIKLKPAKLRIVLTRQPEKYAAETVPGQLEFSSESPITLIKRMRNLGYKKMLLMGGAEIASLFLESNSINEIILTVEPLAFGVGMPMFAAQLEKMVSCELVEQKQLNDRGTLLLRYRIIL